LLAEKQPSLCVFSKAIYTDQTCLINHQIPLTIKKALAFCFRIYRIDAKQLESLIGVYFNKKLDNFLNAIWHYEDLANLSLVVQGAYPIEDMAQVEKQAEEAGEDAGKDEMRIEY
jgi:hypothetical protein